VWRVIARVQHYFCCAMLTTLRDELFANDFAHNLKLLQKYPPIGVMMFGVMCVCVCYRKWFRSIRTAPRGDGIA
jgi:hypothetical protein